MGAFTGAPFALSYYMAGTSRHEQSGLQFVSHPTDMASRSSLGSALTPEGERPHGAPHPTPCSTLCHGVSTDPRGRASPMKLLTPLSAAVLGADQTHPDEITAQGRTGYSLSLSIGLNSTELDKGAGPGPATPPATAPPSLTCSATGRKGVSEPWRRWCWNILEVMTGEVRGLSRPGSERTEFRFREICSGQQSSYDISNREGDSRGNPQGQKQCQACSG